MTLSVAERNLRAEERAVLHGHYALAHPAGGLRVCSETHDRKSYHVTFEASYVGAGVRFTCTPEGLHAFEDDHLTLSPEPGCAPCLHTAVAARRLAREGLVEWSAGLWVATERAAKPAPPVASVETMLGRLASFGGQRPAL